MESSSFSGSSKRAKAPGNITQQLIHCSVDGCNADLSRCKEYHRRHKVCEIHSKTAKVNVAGREQRFCQQCSRFHSLVEFDEGKRSCRKRLDGHNRRRRKPQPTGADSSSSLVLSSQQLGLGSGGTLLSFSTSTSPQRLVPLPTTRSSSNWAMKTDQNDMLLYNYNMERQNECSSAHRSYKQGGLNQFQFIQNTDHHHHHHHHQPLLHPINAHHQQLVVDSYHGALSLLSSAAPPATREFGLNHQDFVPHQQSSIVNYAPGALGHHGDHYPFAQESINKPLVSSADDSHHQMFHHHRPADGSSSSTTTTSTNTASHQTLKFMWE